MGLFDSKTEAPTAKRREEARKKGQVARSREVVSVLVLVAGFWAIRSAGPRCIALFRQQMTYYLSEAMRPDRFPAMQATPYHLTADLAVVLMPLLVAVVLASLVGNIGQTGPMLVATGLKPDFSKLSPVQGAKRLFSAQSLMELLKAVAKVGFVSYLFYAWLRSRYPSILSMLWMDMPSAMQFSGALLEQLFWRMIVALGCIAVVDYVWQKYQHETGMKMSKEEVKEEIRQSEGSPEIRAAIRRRQREIATRRMLADVPKADVVVTNPTHYAVALKYDSDTMDAPTVLALGQRLIAQKIKEVAAEHHVPIVENKPLARALFEACQVGDQVPPDLYAAVAEVLAYVYRLRGIEPGQRP